VNAHLVLQAGGRGERLGSDLPKPLARVGGMAMAERLVRQFLEAGGRRVTIVTGWKADEVEAHFRRLSDLPGDLGLDFLREDRPLGNAGALTAFAGGDKAVLLCFADLVTNLDFAALAAVHAERGSDATLCSHYESHRVRLGELEADGARVTAYREKPVKQFLICSGIALFEPEALAAIDPEKPTGLADLVTRMLAAGRSVTHWLHGAGWMDVNSPEDLEAAEAAVRLWESEPATSSEATPGRRP
jgi:NDP-sugar pyrophosphorylase family protein